MHEYEACPSQEQDTIPGPMQRPDNQDALQTTTKDSEISSIRSSLDPSLTHPDDNGSTTHPDITPASFPSHAPLSVPPEPSSTPGQSSTPAKQGAKEELVQPLLGGYSKSKTSWKLQTTIIGFLSLATICAAVHCGFFVYLDGRVLSNDSTLSNKKTTISQGYVTTISLLLTTAFRAALVAGVGVAYTQYLWATLRERLLKIGHVEDLFQVQTSALHLLSYELYLETPTLAAIAVFCWLVPIATVYPPGALTVELQTLRLGMDFNVSVFHSRDPLRINNHVCSIVCDGYDEGGLVGVYPIQTSSPGISEGVYPLEAFYPPGAPIDVSALNGLGCVAERGSSRDSKYITRMNLMSGKIADLDQPTEGNSSYDLSFWGTTLDCETSNYTMDRVYLQSDIGDAEDPNFYEQKWTILHFDSSANLATYRDLPPIDSVSMNTSLFKNTSYYKYPMGTVSIVHRNNRNIVGMEHVYPYYPCMWGPNKTLDIDPPTEYIRLPDGGIHVFMPVKESICHAKMARYSVTVSHIAGRQNVTYSITDDESIPSYTSSFDDFDGSFEQWVQLSDAMTIYDEFAMNFNKSFKVNERMSFYYPESSEGPKPYTAENGTTVDTCTMWWATSSYLAGNENELEIWPLSIFEEYLRSSGYGNDEPFPPSFNIDMAKELLINSTISALSLNKRFDIVAGTTSRAFNVYQFRNKLAFFLPYGLCLGFGLPILALGLAAFYTRNQGVSAITGGFLQVLMTTTGRGSLENVVLKTSGTMGGHENVSDELKEMKIRFGELIDANDAEDARSAMTSSTRSVHAEHAEGPEILRNEDDDGNVRASMASGVELFEKRGAVAIRAGFGVAEEVRPLRKRATQA